MTHEEIWGAIDALAARHSMSVSRLAREAGLDATTFNKSKRVGVDGRPRWPSTESISKVLSATGESLGEMMNADGALLRTGLPLIGTGQATSSGYFDAAGRPNGPGWDMIDIGAQDPAAWALEVEDDTLEPLYRAGDRLVLSPSADPRRDDPVLARTHGGNLLARILVRRTANVVELALPDGPVATYDVRDLVWLARIVWVSR